MALSKLDREEITSMIKTTVNGKIDKIDEKLTNHIDKHDKMLDEVKVLVDAVRWLDTTRKVAVWLGGLAAAIAGIVGLQSLFK